MWTKSGTCWQSNRRAVIHWAEGESEDALCEKFTASGQVPSTPPVSLTLKKTLRVSFLLSHGRRLEIDFRVWLSLHKTFLSFLLPPWGQGDTFGMSVCLSAGRWDLRTHLRDGCVTAPHWSCCWKLKRMPGKGRGGQKLTQLKETFSTREDSTVLLRPGASLELFKGARKSKQSVHASFFLQVKAAKFYPNRTSSTTWCTCVRSVAQLCSTLHDLTDCSPLGSSVHGICQARMLEWVAISFSRASSWSRDRTCISCVGKWVLYHWATRGALALTGNSGKAWLTPWRKGGAISACWNCSLLGKRSGVSGSECKLKF